MNGNKLLLLIVVIGIAIWNIPNTTSIFQGQHTYYNISAPCQKCHQDIQNILDANNTITNHSVFGCINCHIRDGNSSHAAAIIYCNTCHPIDKHQITHKDCNECHISHGGQKDGIIHGNGYQCQTCHDKV